MWPVVSALHLRAGVRVSVRQEWPRVRSQVASAAFSWSWRCLRCGPTWQVMAWWPWGSAWCVQEREEPTKEQ
eukprot:8496537-Prorocentrum_lima.AAC.1